MIGCREKRDFGEKPPRQRLQTWILFSPSIVDRVVHSMRHDRLNSKVQAAAADVFDRMWTCARGAIGIMLHRMSIEYEAPVDGSCAGVCLLRCDQCLGSAIGGLWDVDGKE